MLNWQLSLRRQICTTTNLLWRKTRRGGKANVGLSHQLKALQHDIEVLQENPEGFADLESTFVEANKSHHAYEQELQQQRDHIRRMIVKRKYFRTDPLPNFLTYSEKERIRLLWDGGKSEEWTFDRLSESFPALPETIQKIASSDWKPLTGKRLRKHDAHVIENWKSLVSGQFNDILPEQLRNHLTKFSNRTEIDLQELEATEKYLLNERIIDVPKANEFQSILGAEYQPRNIRVTNEDKEWKPKELESKSKSSNRQFDKAALRLKDLKEVAKEGAFHVEGLVKTEENLAVPSHLPEWQVDSESPEPEDDVANWRAITRRKSVEITFSPADLKAYEIKAIKARICIPRKLWRKNALYRIDDCYYDDDGEFLYRVLGMNYGGSRK